MIATLPPVQKLLVHVHSVRQKSKCRRCGRRLSDPRSRRAGYGKVCAEKQRYEQAMRGR